MALTSYMRTPLTVTTAFSAVSNTVSETSLFGGLNIQPIIPALQFDGTTGYGRKFRVDLRGVLSTTGTPTIQFLVRLGTTSGSSYLSGTQVLISPSMTTQSGVTNKWWCLQGDILCSTPGIGTGNCTLTLNGSVRSPGGFASPFEYVLEPTTPDTATWTATIDDSLTQYMNVSVIWGTASSSNTITCKQADLIEFN